MATRCQQAGESPFSSPKPCSYLAHEQTSLITHRKMCRLIYAPFPPYPTETLGLGQTLYLLFPTPGSELSSRHSWEFPVQPPQCFLIPFHGMFSEPLSMCQGLISFSSTTSEVDIKPILQMRKPKSRPARALCTTTHHSGMHLGVGGTQMEGPGPPSGA